MSIDDQLDFCSLLRLRGAAFCSEPPEVRGLLAKLQALDIVYIPDQENIPSEYFEDLADIAGEVATGFGAKTDDYVRLVNKGLGGAQGIDVGYGAAAISLRAIVRGRSTEETLRTQYF